MTILFILAFVWLALFTALIITRTHGHRLHERKMVIILQRFTRERRLMEQCRKSFIEDMKRVIELLDEAKKKEGT